MKKQKTREELDREYQENALQCGHKQRIIAQIKRDSASQISKLEHEVQEHVKRLMAVSEEALTVPQETKIEGTTETTTETPTTEPVSA